MEKAKKEYKSLITESKLKQQNSDSNFLNNSRNSGQFWHRYDKIIGRKSNNIVEPIFDNDSQTYIFDNEIISEKLTNYHIRKTVNNDLKSSDFKAEIEKKINEIMISNKLSETVVFFGKQHVKQAIKCSNINSAPGPDRITLDLIENGEDLLALSFTHLMQACYLVGYFPRPWKMENRIYLKKPDKEHCHQENSYRPISLSNTLGKNFERIILQETINILEEKKFFKGKNVYAYFINKNVPQALLPLVEQLCSAIRDNKYGIVVLADLQGAFDSVWRKGALYKLHQADINSNLLAIFSRFFTDRSFRNLVNSYTSEWSFSYTGVPQGSLLSPLIFLIFTADMTTEEVEQLEARPQESKYANDFNFWRIAKDFYSLLIQIQIAIINLQSWCKKRQIETNPTKTKYKVFYNKKKLLPLPFLPVEIDEVPVSKVTNKRALGIIIDEDLSFTPHIAFITKKYKQAYNRLTLFPSLNPHLALQLYKSFIRSRLEFGSIVWGFKLYQREDLKMLESAHELLYP